MSRSIFGWDLPPGCTHADIERAFGEPEDCPEVEEAFTILDGSEVDPKIIDRICEIINGLADRAYNCPECAKRQNEAEAKLDKELDEAGKAYWASVYNNDEPVPEELKMPKDQLPEWAFCRNCSHSFEDHSENLDKCFARVDDSQCGCVHWERPSGRGCCE